MFGGGGVVEPRAGGHVQSEIITDCSEEEFKRIKLCWETTGGKEGGSLKKRGGKHNARKLGISGGNQKEK